VQEHSLLRSCNGFLGEQISGKFLRLLEFEDEGILTDKRMASQAVQKSVQQGRSK
jgi:hypothetical protein